MGRAPDFGCRFPVGNAGTYSKWICNLRQEAQRFLAWSEQNKSIEFNSNSLVSLNVSKTNTSSDAQVNSTNWPQKDPMCCWQTSAWTDTQVHILNCSCCWCLVGLFVQNAKELAPKFLAKRLRNALPATGAGQAALVAVSTVLPSPFSPGSALANFDSVDSDQDVVSLHGAPLQSLK